MGAFGLNYLGERYTETQRSFLHPRADQHPAALPQPVMGVLWHVLKQQSLNFVTGHYDTLYLLLTPLVRQALTIQR